MYVWIGSCEQNLTWKFHPELAPAGPANAMWRKLLYSGFQTCFGPSTQGAGIRYQNTSRIQILLASHFEKKGRDLEWAASPPSSWPLADAEAVIGAWPLADAEAEADATSRFGAVSTLERRTFSHLTSHSLIRPLAWPLAMRYSVDQSGTVETAHAVIQFENHFQYCTVFVRKDTHVERNYLI